MKIIILALLIFQIVSKLTVSYPEELAKQFSVNNETGRIQFDRANFGHYPYGRQLKNIAMLANVTDQCGQLEMSQSTPFIVLYQGNCTFVSQVKNIQNAGGSMAIIISNQDEVKSNYVLANDGYGFQIQIPTIFIGSKDGNKLVDWIRAHESDLPKLIIQFPVKHQSRAQIDLALALNDRTTFKMTRDLHQYLLTMYREGTIQLDVYYQIYSCKECQSKNFTEEVEQCLGGGRYCGLQPEELSMGSGRDLLMETIRQTCLFELDPFVYIKYIANFDQNCFIPNRYKECSDRFLRLADLQLRSNLRIKVLQCEENSFNKTSNQNYLLQSNEILDKQFQFKKYSGMSGFPGLAINGRPYVGNLEAKFIMEAICESISYNSQACYEFPQFKVSIQPEQSYSNKQMEVWEIIALVFVIIILCGTLMGILYKKIIKREVKAQTSGQVNHLVEQYIEFYEQKSKRNP